MLTPIFPSTFQGNAQNTTYTIDAHPVLYAVGGAALAIVLLVLLVVLAWRTKGALVPPIVPALAAPLAGGIAFLWLVPWGKRTTTDFAVDVFRDALVLDGVAVGVGVGTVAATILIMAIRDDGHLRLLKLSLPIVLLGLVITRASIVHAHSIRDAGSLPFYVVDGPAEMHAGRSYDVPVSLMGSGHRWWLFGWHDASHPTPVDEATRLRWDAQSTVRVEAKSPGDVSFTARGKRGPITLESRLKVRARREVASPLLSLRVGDEFIYRVHARSSEGLLLYFISVGPASEHVDELRIRVLEARARNGFRTFALSVDRDGEHRELEVVAVDGETREYDVEHGKIGAEIIEHRIDDGAPDPVPCSFALLGAHYAKCQRGGRSADVPAPPLPTAKSKVKLERRRLAPQEANVARPPVAFAGAAPAYFERHTSNTGGTIASAFVAIVTIGLVIPPDGSRHSSYTLVATHRGAEGAPEVR